jgi:dienelactone hydrolase
LDLRAEAYQSMRRDHKLTGVAAVLAAALCAGAAPMPSAAPTGLQSDVVFSDYPERASESRILTRLLSPLAAGYIRHTLEVRHEAVQEHSLEVSAEHFVLYVPPTAPAHGYGLLVFIPPWKEARVPPGWTEALDRLGVIYVSPAAAGNDTSDIERRAPLALIATGNLLQRYPIDPGRVYVGGFSGGSRLALRVALGFPDLFHGALLNAGSDPIDAGPPTPPEAPLLQQFQEGSRIVFVTGAQDKLHLQMDEDSVAALRRWCVFDYQVLITPRADHQVAGASAFAQALRRLMEHQTGSAARMESCRAEIVKRRDQQLQHVSSLLSAGRTEEAQKLLLETDRHFGGIATPQTLELQSSLGWNSLPTR